VFAIFNSTRFIRLGVRRFRQQGTLGFRRLLLLVARGRNIFLIWIAAILPVSFVMTQQASLYDGIRHTLFVIPLLAVIGGWAAVKLWHSLGRLRVLAAAFATIYAACLTADLVFLHPLEYTAMNVFTGGTAGAYTHFELDYWSAASTEALRQLENRLDWSGAAAPPSILVCMPNREHMIKLMLGSRWLVELDPEKADFVIESERWRCARNHPTLILLDEVTRYNQAFAWTYVNEQSRYLDLAFSHRVCCTPATSPHDKKLLVEYVSLVRREDDGDRSSGALSRHSGRWRQR